MNNIIKKVLEQNGIKVDNSDCDNVIFSNGKTDLFYLVVLEGCWEDKRLILAKLYDNAEEFDDAKEFIDENYIDERLFALKDTSIDNLNDIDLYSYVKSLFELIDSIDTKEELKEFLEEVNQDWLLQ